MKYNIEQFQKANSTIAEYTFRAYDICELFSEQYPRLWLNVSNDLNDLEMLDTSVITTLNFKLGYSKYCNGEDVQAYGSVTFPFSLMNMSDKEIVENYTVEIVDDKNFEYRLTKKK